MTENPIEAELDDTAPTWVGFWHVRHPRHNGERWGFGGIHMPDAESAQWLAARINGTNQPTEAEAKALSVAAWCLIAAETRDLGHLDDLAAANVDPQSRRLKETIDRRRSELAVLLAPQPTHTVHPDLLDGTNLIRHWLVGRSVDSVGLAAELRQWADHFDPWEQPTDLPDGASPWLGDEADAVALPEVACELDDDEWMWSRSGNSWLLMGDLRFNGSPHVVLLRRKPQTVTVELPKDVAEAMCDEVNIDYHTVAAACREALGR